MFIDGYLALCGTVGTGTATEVTGVPGYVRQPISFGEPTNGVTVNANAYSFGMGTRWTNNGIALYPTPAGRAIFDAPSGGNLLLVLPFASTSGRLPWDMGDAAHIQLQLSALAGFPRGASFTGRIAAGAAAGGCSDRFDIVNPGNISQYVNTAVMTAGVALSIKRGILQAAAMVPAGSE